MKRVIALACPCLAQAQEVAGRPALWTSHPNADAPPTPDGFQAKYADVEVEWSATAPPR